MIPSSFKVVVVGGGPVGLVAAHALSRAGIDFVLLERRPRVVEDVGASVVLQAMGLRAMGQLGLLEAIGAAGTTLRRFDRVDHGGRDMGDMKWFELSAERCSCGTYPLVVGRYDLTKLLYESLPEDARAKILTNKQVKTVSTTTAEDGEGEGVTVHCADGTVHTGSVVVGADGAHSIVRGEMRRLALEAGAAEEEVNAEKPYLTTYRCLWLRCPTSLADDLKAGNTCESHGAGCTSQLFAGEETTIAGIYERMGAPTRDRVRYGEADKEDMVSRWGDIPLSPGGKLTLRKAFEGSTQSALVSLEEGVVERWSWEGRVVLAGDAAHKYTPSTGAGCNTGIIDVVVLVNKLRRALLDAGEKGEGEGEKEGVSGCSLGMPDRTALAQAFTEYQDARRQTVVKECASSGNATAMASWATGVLGVLDRWVMGSHRVQRYFSAKTKAYIARTPVFDFIEAEEAFEGSVPWEVRMPGATGLTGTAVAAA